MNKESIADELFRVIALKENQDLTPEEIISKFKSILDKFQKENIKHGVRLAMSNIKQSVDFDKIQSLIENKLK